MVNAVRSDVCLLHSAVLIMVVLCSDKLSKLFTLAKQSKGAVDNLLRPDASRQEINSFWKSEETKRLIDEESALKQLVFNQMLQASA